MAYSAEISRNNPSCFVFLIDQSGSMGDAFGTGEGKKADALAVAINRLLQNLVIKCAKEEGVRDFFHVGVVGYGAQVGPGFTGPLAGQQMVPISQIGSSPARMEQRTKKVSDGAGGLVDQPIRFPVWFDPTANGGTPMCQALGVAKSLVESWLEKHGSCYPPTVINMTDGESTDGDPTSVVEQIRKLRSNDGEVLLFNAHLSSQKAAPIEYPNSEAGLPDQFAQQLFRMSSPMPEYMLKIAKQEGMSVAEGSRGFVFNADLVSIVKFLDIGTRPNALR
ncbi:MAG: VWA domain-containing protein [Verrucomicrobiota bacterium]